MGFDATGGKPHKASQDGPVWYATVGAVIAIAFGAAFMGSKLMGGGDPTAKISTLVEGRSVPEAAGLINVYGFKDQATKDFLTRLQKGEPEEHAILLTGMAKAALKGADRAQLAGQIMDWTQGYAMTNAQYLRHADPRYIDKILPLARNGLAVMSKSNKDLCVIKPDNLQNMDAAAINKTVRYGDPLYEVSMQANFLLVGMVTNGRKRMENGQSEKAMAQARQMSQEDQNAIAAAMMSMMGDPDVQKIMSAVQQGKTPSVDVCQLGSKLVSKIEGLPSDVRQSIWMSAVSGGLGPIS